jgi:hypothetical protein
VIRLVAAPTRPGSSGSGFLLDDPFIELTLDKSTFGF